jgi:lysophospholipase L1-like esterase
MTTEEEQNDLQRYSDNLDAILGRLYEAGAVVGVALLDDQSLRPVAIKGEAFPSTTKADLQLMSAHVVKYNAILQAKATQYGGFTVDFYNTTIFTNPATLYDDGNHPNGNGYDLIAEMWLGAITPLIAK